MADWQDTVAHIRHIDIPACDLARWETTAKRLVKVTPDVVTAMSELHADPCPHRIWRVANAARYASKIADEPLKTDAIALAEELEARAI